MAHDRKVPLAAVALVILHVYGLGYVWLLAAAAVLLFAGLHHQFFLVVSFRQPRRRGASPEAFPFRRPVDVPLFQCTVKIIH